MRRLLAAVLSGLLAAGVAPALACTDPGGIGGTGISDGGGIGGTGARAEVEVGLLGVITGFGSICVNGVRVEYQATTPVSANGEPASAAALRIGQVVAVRATGSGTQARAHDIAILDAAVGPLDAVEARGTLLRVQGQQVRVEPSTVLGGGLSAERLAAAKPGESLRVSGLRSADGAIVATRIEPAAPDARGVQLAAAPAFAAGRFLVQGYVSDVQADLVRVGDQTFSAPAGMAAQLARDRLVRVAGRVDGASRVIERADVLGSPFSIRPDSVVRPQREARERRDEPEDGDRSGRGRGRGDDARPDRSGRDRERLERPERNGSSSGRH